MREIKFRGLSSDGSGWIYGDLLHVPCKMFASIFGQEPIDNNIQVNYKTVGQYTGLKDKNGVEIYEGDKCLVERPCVGAVGKIKFHQGCFIFEENHTENILRLCDLKLNNYTIEVIGNIHEGGEENR